MMSFFVTPDLKRQLERDAKRRGMTLETLVRAVIANYFHRPDLAHYPLGEPMKARVPLAHVKSILRELRYELRWMRRDGLEDFVPASLNRHFARQAGKAQLERLRLTTLRNPKLPKAGRKAK
jgi:hypothetical protein